MNDRAPVLRQVAVVGAASQIGTVLLPRLAARGVRCLPLGRSAHKADAPFEFVYDERRDGFEPALKSADAVISLAPLPAVAAVLQMARRLGARRLIAFGSTGRFSKQGSSSALERDFVNQQEAAERLLAEMAAEAGIHWTLFRPTMIYGAGSDQTVAFIRAVIRRVGVFPIPRGADGLRQPVHVDDLAAACVEALDCERTFDRAYDLGGGERIGYREMVRRIFLAESMAPRLLAIPAPAYRALIWVAKRFSFAQFVRPEMVERMFRDLVADNGPAYDDFGYSPRRFLAGDADGRP